MTETRREAGGQTYSLIRVRGVCDHILLQVLLEPGQVCLLGEEELVLLPPREDLDKGTVVGRRAALDGVPRHDRVSLRQVKHPQVEQVAELEREVMLRLKAEYVETLCLPVMPFVYLITSLS